MNVYIFLAAICFVISISKSLGVAPKIKLNDGREVPALGLGTWLGLANSGPVKVKGNDVEKAVKWAIDVGYRHFDTAAIYNTEPQVGRAINKRIADGVVKREDLFITTKLWNDRHAKDDVVPALRESLKNLDLEYVDLYLIHWPVAEYANHTLQDVDYVEAWAGMVQAQELGLAKSIGVSNFNQQQLDRLLALSPVKPAMLQVEINLNLQQPDLLAYCKTKNITVTAYTPFGSLLPSKAAEDAPPPRIDDPAMVAIAQKYNKTVPQITLRYLVELGVLPIPKSVTKERIEQNIDVFSFSLTHEERVQLKGYDKHYRTIPVRHWASSPYYPFVELLEKKN